MSTQFGAPDDELRPIAHSRVLAHGTHAFNNFNVPGLNVPCQDVRAIMVYAASGGAPVTCKATFHAIDPAGATATVVVTAVTDSLSNPAYVRVGGHVLVSLNIDDGGAGTSGAWAVTASNLDPLASGAGAGALPFAFVQSNAVTVVAASTDYWFDMALGYISDASVFDLATAIAAGNPYHGIRFLKNGVYHVETGFAWINTTAGDRCYMQNLVGGGESSGFLVGDELKESPRTTDGWNAGWIDAEQVGGATFPAAPTVAQLFNVKNGTGARGTVVCSVFYTYIGPGILFP